MINHFLYNLKFVRKKPLLIPRLLKNYFSMLLLNEQLLRGVDIATNYRCQANCDKCSVSKFRPSKEMTIEEVKYVIDQCLKLGAVHFNFTGGEPLLREDIFDIMAYIKPNQSFISLLTNGILLTNKNIDHLKEVGCDMLFISLDSPYEREHDAKRGFEGCFKRVINAIKYAKSKGFIVTLDTVITPELLRSGKALKLVEFAKELGILIYFVFPCAVGKWTSKEVSLSGNDQKIFKALLKHPNVRTDLDSSYHGRYCPAGKENIYITASGDVLPCPFIHLSFGNMLKENPRNILKKMQQFPVFKKPNKICLASEDGDFIEKFIKPLNKYKKMPVNIDDLTKK